VKHLVVIGGSDAGISAALRAREVDPGWAVTLVCADAFPNFSTCGLPFYLSGETPRWESLAHRTRADIESRGIELWLHCVAECVDPAGHRVQVTSADRGLQSLSYDRLVIATGAVPAPPPIAGLDTAGVYPLHTMGESFAVQEHLQSRQPRSAVIVGGGYIGVEMADALRHRGLCVTLLEAGSSVLQTVDPEFGAHVREELTGHEVDVRTSARVQSVARDGRGLVVRGSGFEHKQGRVAGENAVGGNAVFEGSLGTQVVKIFDLVAGRTGLRDAEAVHAGFVPITRETVVWDHKNYYPGASELRIRTTGDARNGRLLGAQLLGRYGAEVSKRLDVLAMGLFHEVRVDALEHVDLSYTPPLGSPWDAVQMATMEWALHAPEAVRSGGHA
jgi:NADPH-dependent 2,4-dienoyl-CoA reductase/sulfur reductase-like enzyme